MTENPAPYGPGPSPDFDSQYARVFQAAECRTQVELADFLEIRQSSISDAKRRKAIPSEWLIKLFDKKRINPEWLRMGIGGKFVQISLEDEAKAATIVHAVKYRPPEDCTTDELFAELVRRVLKNAV